MTVNELQDYLKVNQTVILPYGVVEQHGYHLPLDTDIRNAEIMSLKIAAELGCVVAPTINYCFSGGMLAGTINIKPNTFANLVGEIIESLALQGFRNVIIIPGHGGSESMFHLKESLRILKWTNPALHEIMILMMPLWDYSPTWLEKFRSRDYHAAEVETSLIKYWTPDAVRDSVVMDAPDTAEMLRKNPDSFQRLTSFTGDNHEIINTSQRQEVKVGVMGYPENATEELGRKVTEEIIGNMVPALRQMLSAAEAARITGCCHDLENANEVKILSL